MIIRTSTRSVVHMISEIQHGNHTLYVLIALYTTGGSPPRILHIVYPNPTHLTWAAAAEALTTLLSLSLSTTSTRFSTAKTARQALVQFSSPVASVSRPDLLSFELEFEDPKPMTDMEERVGICMAEIPGRRIEWPEILSLRILPSVYGVEKTRPMTIKPTTGFARKYC